MSKKGKFQNRDELHAKSMYTLMRLGFIKECRHAGCARTSKDEALRNGYCAVHAEMAELEELERSTENARRKKVLETMGDFS